MTTTTTATTTAGRKTEKDIKYNIVLKNTQINDIKSWAELSKSSYRHGVFVGDRNTSVTIMVWLAIIIFLFLVERILAGLEFNPWWLPLAHFFISFFTCSVCFRVAKHREKKEEERYFERIDAAAKVLISKIEKNHD